MTSKLVGLSVARMSTSSVMLITGCASGIGRHLAGALSARGHRVVATDLDLAKLERERASLGWPEGSVKLAALDVRDPEAWEAALDLAEREFGSIDVVLNVAGFLNPGYVVDLEARDVDLHFDVNVKGVVYGTRAAARRMVQRGAGHVVNFGSLASLAPVPGLSLYSASKFAVRGFSLAAATELRERGVAVSLVLPDAVETPMLDKQVAHEEAALTFSGSRTLTVEDIERVLVNHVLAKRPMEVTIPNSRGFLARVANVAPDASRLLAPMLLARGKKAQAKRRGA